MPSPYHNLRLYDSTMLRDYSRCPRYFYFRHVLGWRGAGPFNIKAAFGIAWSAAMDSLWVHADIDLAQAAFMEKWNELGQPPEDQVLMAQYPPPHRPSVCREMLVHYLRQREPLFNHPSFKVLTVEKPFAVPLDPNDDTLWYTGRCDKVIEYEGRVYVVDHKSTGQYSKSKLTGEGGFKWSFLQSFSPNKQVDGYFHYAHCVYGDRVDELWIDAALVHKEHHDKFKIIPIKRADATLELWLWETRALIQEIEAYKRQMQQIVPEDLYMAAFPRDTDACFKFNSQCTYHGPCVMWPNPTGKTPKEARLVEDRWSPFKDTDQKDVQWLKT